MKRYCYSLFHIGNRYLGEKEPMDNSDITHGLCDECYLKELDEIEKYKIKEETWKTEKRNFTR